MRGSKSPKEIADWSDEQLLQAAPSRPWLFAELVNRYEEAFLRKARSIIRDERDAEEVVQDAFTKIYVHASKFQPQDGAKFSSWAYRILMNTAFTRYQKLTKEGERFAAIDPEFEHLVKDTSEHQTQSEDRDAIERILSRLPQHVALVLRLHYLERWPQQDIAAELDESVGTVKARIHRAKAAFKKEATSEEQATLL